MRPVRSALFPLERSATTPQAPRRNENLSLRMPDGLWGYNRMATGEISQPMQHSMQERAQSAVPHPGQPHEAGVEQETQVREPTRGFFGAPRRAVRSRLDQPHLVSKLPCPPKVHANATQRQSFQTGFLHVSAICPAWGHRVGGQR